MSILKDMDADPAVGNLVISRRPEEWFVVDSNPPVLVQVTESHEGKTRLRVLVDRDTKIFRSEVFPYDKQQPDADGRGGSEGTAGDQ